jgi:hypothetical protein
MPMEDMHRSYLFPLPFSASEHKSLPKRPTICGATLTRDIKEKKGTPYLEPP